MFLVNFEIAICELVDYGLPLDLVVLSFVHNACLHVKLESIFGHRLVFGLYIPLIGNIGWHVELESIFGHRLVFGPYIPLIGNIG